METESRFDLNQAITEWRMELAAHPGLTDDNLRELESHLREAVAEAMTRGLSGQEALDSAVKQIGESSRLASEFARENTGLIWRQRLFWMALAALVMPPLFGLPFLLLSIAARWLQQAGYSAFASALYDVAMWPVVVAVPPALAVGFLLTVSRGRRLALRDCVLCLTRHGIRLLAASITALLLWLGLYAYTDHSRMFLQLLECLALGVTVTVGMLTLPERLGATGFRRVLRWLISSRNRLGVLLSLLVLVPMVWNLVGIYFTLEFQIVSWLKLQAGSHASMIALKMLLVGVVIGFQPKVIAAPNLTEPETGPSSTAGHWCQWSIWMCAGCLFLVAWGVIQTGLNELMIRGIDQWWARALIGIGLPLAIAGWVWRPSNSTPRAVVIKGAQTVSSSGLRIVSVALLLALLGFGVKWLQLETAMQFSGSGQSSILDAFRTQAWWVMMSQIWPAALLGLLLDQMTRHHDHARKT